MFSSFGYASRSFSGRAGLVRLFSVNSNLGRKGAGTLTSVMIIGGCSISSSNSSGWALAIRRELLGACSFSFFLFCFFFL